MLSKQDLEDIIWDKISLYTEDREYQIHILSLALANEILDEMSIDYTSIVNIAIVKRIRAAVLKELKEGNWEL